MDAGLLGLIIPSTALIGGAIGWWLGHRRQAALDAIETLHRKKLLLEEMLSKAAGTDREQSLCGQLDDVNHELHALYSERIRRTLRVAKLPAEEILIAHGREQLSPEQSTNLEEAAAEVAALPVTPSVEDLLTLGSAYYYAGRYDKALEVYNWSLELQRDNPVTLASRAIIYDKMGKYEEALADLNRSLELRPDHPATLMNRGATYDKLGRYDEALADLNHSLELRPDNPETLYNRGVTHRHLGRYEEALADYNRSLELQPDDPATLINRGVTYGYMGKYEEALSDYNRSLELRPDHPTTLYNLACLFSLWEKADEALGYLERAIACDEKYREMAKTDKDFNNIREDPRFQKLVEPD